MPLIYCIEILAFYSFDSVHKRGRCLSVRLSRSGIVSIRLNLLPKKSFHRLMALIIWLSEI